MTNPVKIFTLAATFILLNACGSSDSQNKKSTAPVGSSPVVATSGSADVEKAAPQSQVAQGNKTPASVQADIAAMKAEKASLEQKKASLLNQKDQAMGAKANPAIPGGIGSGPLGAGIDAAAIGIDKAKIDALIKAVMDNDPDAIQKAIDGLIASIGDIQKKIEALAASIIAAEKK